jgi:hypothetical protein
MKNILFKGSGDVIDSQKFFNFVIKKSQHNYAVVICGGGTKISRALEEAGYKIYFDEFGRRITKTWKERIIMCNILEHEKKGFRISLLEEAWLLFRRLFMPALFYAQLMGMIWLRLTTLVLMKYMCLLKKNE